MSVMFMCNNNYNSTSTEEKLVNNDESRAFFKVADNYLYKEVNRTLDWLKKLNLLNYEIVYMVISSEKSREATAEEKSFIDNYYEFAKNNFTLNGFGLKYCANDLLQEVNDEFEKQQGKSICKHYKTIKFFLTDELVSNTAKLESDAKLNNNCGHDINSMVCNKLYELVLKFIQKNIGSIMSFEEFLVDFELNGAPLKNKFNENWKFNSDDDFVKRTIKELVYHYIKID